MTVPQGFFPEEESSQQTAEIPAGFFPEEQATGSQQDVSPGHEKLYKEIAEGVDKEKPIPFFERLGLMASLGPKMGGFSGAPTATPKQAAKIATEVGTYAAVEGAFKPVYGAIKGTKIGHDVLRALTNLTEAGTKGATIGTTSKLVESGELPSKEELLKDGLTWVAIDAAMQAAHLGGNFSKAVSDIAKNEGMSKTDVLSRLWGATKNWIKGTRGRNIKRPQDVKVEDARRLANQAERAASDGLDTIDTVPDKPLFKAAVPEHELIEKIQEPLEAQSQRAIQEAERLKPGGSTSMQPPTAPEAPSPYNEREMQTSVGEVISPTRIPNANIASRSVRDTINRESSSDYARVRRLYQDSKEANARAIDIRPQMVGQLEQLVDELSLAEVPSTVQRDIIKTAKKFIKAASAPGDSLVPISNSKIIAQIEANNQKINHDFMQGRPANAYLRLNQILEDAVSEAADASPEAVNAWDKARRAYRNWAQLYGSKEVLPWRDPSNQSHAKLLKSIENPDSLAVLEPILSKSSKGRSLYDAIRRDFSEKKLRPFIKDPTKTRTVEYDETHRDLAGLLSQDERYAIHDLLDQRAADQERHETRVRDYQQAKQSHKALVAEQKDTLNKWRKDVEAINKRSPYKSDSSILRDLQSVRGLQRIEGALEEAVKDAEEFKKLMQEIKDYAAVNLLTNGEILPSGKSLPLQKIFNDVNKRALLDHTLGPEATKTLAEIVYKAPQIDSHFKKWLKRIKMGAKLIPGVRGHVATGEAVWEIWRMFRPAVVEGDYSTVDVELIRKIIENKDALLGETSANNKKGS